MPDDHVFLYAESGDPLMLAPEVRTLREATVPWEEGYFIGGFYDSGGISIVGT